MTGSAGNTHLAAGEGHLVFGFMSPYVGTSRASAEARSASRILSVRASTCDIGGPARVARVGRESSHEPVRASTVRAASRFEPTTASVESTVVPDIDEVVPEYTAHVLLRRWQDRRFWPLASDVDPAWFVIVDEVSDAQSILEIVAMAPLGPGDERVGWYRRTGRGWVADPTLARRLARVTTELLVSVSAETVRELEDQDRGP